MTTETPEPAEGETVVPEGEVESQDNKALREKRERAEAEVERQRVEREGRE